MEKSVYTISFKRKLIEIEYENGEVSKFFEFPKKVNRDHASKELVKLRNLGQLTDTFINSLYMNEKGNSYVGFLDKLQENIYVDTSKFLLTVTIDVYEQIKKYIKA